VTLDGEHLHYDDVAFSSGTEVEPLGPVRPPPIWIVSNPRITGADSPATRRNVERAARRIARFGDGWMTCCRAAHPEEVEEQAAAIGRSAADLGRDPEAFTVTYQVTMNVGDSAQAAEEDFAAYIGAYYPEFGSQVDLSDWGPVGTPDVVAAWLRRFADAGVGHFICRFGSSDQPGQLARFASEVLPTFEGDRGGAVPAR
jgi:alkanesulfonate monooxygenase SsuD/methylene tetrahydromethanopterin reductase-like flavin-dependent oxidoreductase (luciferase family)